MNKTDVSSDVSDVVQEIFRRISNETAHWIVKYSEQSYPDGFPKLKYICSYCGKGTGGNFCSNCGRKMSEEIDVSEVSEYWNIEDKW